MRLRVTKKSAFIGVPLALLIVGALWFGVVQLQHAVHQNTIEQNCPVPSHVIIGGVPVFSWGVFKLYPKQDASPEVCTWSNNYDVVDTLVVCQPGYIFIQGFNAFDEIVQSCHGQRLNTSEYPRIYIDKVVDGRASVCDVVRSEEQAAVDIKSGGVIYYFKNPGDPNCGPNHHLILPGEPLPAVRY